MSDLSFRKATPSDVPSLLKLVQSAYRGEASREGWTTEADLVVDDRIDEPGLLAKINQPHGRVLITFAAASSPAGSEPLACCEVTALEGSSESATLGLFAVNPKLQNGGIGRRVLAEAERCARDEMGITAMEMNVVWSRAELLAWYERRGYKVVEGETRPFPYDHLPNGRAGALRQDLYFKVLRKQLV
ncbi:acyl-CoA N-acyltransferase [Cryphonectria parasitica EP155]|uniref:Acyl-CoA N-acyltransferase n=1 Tax=Cryphonectria parasitica (strain ATCC 38755 / EP155) TaxID=660469 RepID=A0A9P4Y2D0_CRYP1|nr:acyl-CoA N-acyltransferase [Cryphonectria parasitica EP155]KAF3765729.1 acyl-CoA N-acyltransferase [Cryphonectria parasitica EP155]